MVNTLLQSSHVSLRHGVLRHQLGKHKLYSSINNIENLKVFMEHHVYAVWDFMSLIKSLQKHIAPTAFPWVPPKNPRYANFINQLVLEEESDYALSNTSESTHASHFESYLHAMTEIGANTETILNFLEVLKAKNLTTALQLSEVPAPAKHFMRFTFDIIESNKPYLLTAALAYGREDLVPQLFQCLQDEVQIDPNAAPNLYAYLERHIQLDGEEHGPLAVQLLQELCAGSSQKLVAAMAVAEQALEIRLKFWNGINSVLMH